ncbi:MAG: ABC transporter permease [Alphaproteobacteria bacterium]
MSAPRRHRPVGRLAVGALIVAIIAAVALVSLVWTPYPADRMMIAVRLQGPSALHWLGTDQFGRDVLSRLMVGARGSIAVGLFAVGIGLVAGTALGVWAAARRGWVDEVAARLADVIFAFPLVISALLASAILGPGVINPVLAIGIFNISVFARVSRAAAMQVWGLEYTRAALAIGKGPLRVTIDHVLPNIAPVLIVQATASFAIAVLVEAALSYLGLSVRPPAPSWGRMLFDAQTLLALAPTLAIFPGLAIALAVFGLNLLGDGLRDALDPRLADTARPDA